MDRAPTWTWGTDDADQDPPGLIWTPGSPVPVENVRHDAIRDASPGQTPSSLWTWFGDGAELNDLPGLNALLNSLLSRKMIEKPADPQRTQDPRKRPAKPAAPSSQKTVDPRKIDAKFLKASVNILADKLRRRPLVSSPLNPTRGKDSFAYTGFASIRNLQPALRRLSNRRNLGTESSALEGSKPKKKSTRASKSSRGLQPIDIWRNKAGLKWKLHKQSKKAWNFSPPPPPPGFVDSPYGYVTETAQAE
ncbi:hypothetical protein PHLCEN_2v11172 [Hermanssonia centrifuga]|uniref:Uncharacterized protein n=1 Tax=Hermanssonia centrifuga TaxID=98765 RepID=A0A2R6NKM3_9APHY|nr:hypothetical protein PHLCEN_2v11172 [Hermanssonia centrifuga]